MHYGELTDGGVANLGACRFVAVHRTVDGMLHVVCKLKWIVDDDDTTACRGGKLHPHETRNEAPLNGVVMHGAGLNPALGDGAIGIDNDLDDDFALQVRVSGHFSLVAIPDPVQVSPYRCVDDASVEGSENDGLQGHGTDAASSFVAKMSPSAVSRGA